MDVSEKKMISPNVFSLFFCLSGVEITPRVLTQEQFSLDSFSDKSASYLYTTWFAPQIMSHTNVQWIFFLSLSLSLPGGRSVPRCQYWKCNQHRGGPAHLTGAGWGKMSVTVQKKLFSLRQIEPHVCSLWSLDSVSAGNLSLKHKCFMFVCLERLWSSSRHNTGQSQGTSEAYLMSLICVKNEERRLIWAVLRGHRKAVVPLGFPDDH